MVIESPFGKIIIPHVQKIQEVNNTGDELKLAKIRSKLSEIRDIIENGIENCADVENPASCYANANLVIMNFLRERNNFPLSSDSEYKNAIDDLKKGERTPIGTLDFLYPGFLEQEKYDFNLLSNPTKKAGFTM